MDSESRGHTDYDAEFTRIVAGELGERPQPIGPYMRWPLGAALVLISGQVFAAVLRAVVAAMLLTGGHSTEVTNGELTRTIVEMTVLALVLAAVALGVRARSSDALKGALAIETVIVVVRVFFVIRDSPSQLGPYLALAWAAAAVVALVVPSTRRYCTR